MTLKTIVEVPADPRWRHVVAATVLSAVRAGRPDSDAGFNLGELGDVSVLVDRALDNVDHLAGVTRLLVEVESDQNSTLINVVGTGDEVEPPPWSGLSPEAAFTDPLTGATFVWSPRGITCSFRIP